MYESWPKPKHYSFHRENLPAWKIKKGFLENRSLESNPYFIDGRMDAGFDVAPQPALKSLGRKHASKRDGERNRICGQNIDRWDGAMSTLQLLNNFLNCSLINYFIFTLQQAYNYWWYSNPGGLAYVSAPGPDYHFISLINLDVFVLL